MDRKNHFAGYFLWFIILFLTIQDCYSNVEPQEGCETTPDGGTDVKDLIDLTKYHSYGEILQYVKKIVKSDGDIFKVNRIGRTFEGRDLLLVKASDSNFSDSKPAILIDAGAHAREWAAVAAALDIIEDIRLDKSGLLDYADWYIIPVVNPDGYEYSRNYDRNWRKNRVKHNNSNCYGTDVNRNYDFHWGESGVEDDPCSYESYPGPWPLSEKESQAVARVMRYYSSKIKLYTSLHSFGNYMVYPYGYSATELPTNWRILNFFATNVTGEVGLFNGDKFHVMSAGEWYPGAGGSDDYAFAVAGIPYSYTIEVTDGYNFDYPEELLDVLRQEVQVMFKACAVLIDEEFGPIDNYDF